MHTDGRDCYFFTSTSSISFTKGAIDGAGRTVGDQLINHSSCALYGITGDESYDKIRKYIVEQGKQRNAQYDRDLGAFKKNDTDVATAMRQVKAPKDQLKI